MLLQAFQVIHALVLLLRVFGFAQDSYARLHFLLDIRRSELATSLGSEV